nr:30S ribosomal protein S3 [Cyclobacteriaceae bacterium]
QTVYGKIGIKVWIFKGEVYGKRDLSPNVGMMGATGGESKPGGQGGDRRRPGGDRGQRGERGERSDRGPRGERGDRKKK